MRSPTLWNSSAFSSQQFPFGTPPTGIEPASSARRSSFQDYRLTIRLRWHLGGVPMVVSPQGQYDDI